MAGIETGCREPLPPVVVRLEVDRNEPQPIRNTETELDQALSFPGLRTRLVDLKNKQTRSDLWPALRESIEASSENDVLPDATAHMVDD